MVKNRYPVKKTRKWRPYGYVLLALIVVAVFVSGSFYVWQRVTDPQTLPIQDIRIVGHFQHLNPAQLKVEIRQNLTGNFFSANLKELEDHLIAMPWVADLSMRRFWPGILWVKVIEQQPAARWNDQDLLNFHGQIFRVPIDEIPNNVPQLFGPEHTEKKVMSVYFEFNPILKPLNLTIHQLRLTEQQNWELILSNGIPVALGQQNVRERLQRLVHWYPKLINDKSTQVLHIDLRYPHAIAIEWRQ